MKKKYDFDICSLINFDSNFREHFNKCFKVRNFYTDKPDVYFEFEFTPSSEMVSYIESYADSISGYAKFSRNMKQFEIFIRK